MQVSGILSKMPTSRGADSTVRYTLRLEQARPGVGLDPPDFAEVDLNRFIGASCAIEFDGSRTCVRCGRSVDRLFGEGLCYPCFTTAPEASECIVRPELCEAHLGRGRDPAWEEAHHNTPHTVYFAVSSALKVGVTRDTNLPTRWIDQGASWAVAIAHTPYRRLAGTIEVALKDLYTDRTAWQRMLKTVEPPSFDLAAEAARVRDRVAAADAGLVDLLLPAAEMIPTEITYPMESIPERVRSHTLDKAPTLAARLIGIRGQYMVFEDGTVFNVRRHSGYRVTVDLGE